MADIPSYPQIPATVWWGVRSILNKTPRIAISEDLLGIELSVQPAAARQYVTELKRVGLLTEENRASDLAHKWRMDETYQDAVAEILEASYGEELLAVAPSPIDRTRAIAWFQRQGLGEGSARNKAATYVLIASALPGEAAPRSGNAVAQKPKAVKFKEAKAPANTAPANNVHVEKAGEGGVEQQGGSIFPVNLNLQIHISADASVDQIDAIFGSMRKHLGNARLS